MNKQTNLDSFFAVKNKTKKVFFVDWTHDSPIATWLKEKPEEITYECLVEWKILKRSVQVCCYDNSPPYTIPNEMFYKNVPMLKSHLQKCIRRQLTDKAVMTAWHLIKMDINSFIRRLPVIMLEDVSLHSSLSTLIWLVAAISKGYLITLKQIEWILGIVEYLCFETYQNYTVLNQCPGSGVKNISKLIKEIDTYSIINSQNADLLYCLLFRLSYGGMKGDMNMFYYYTENWLNNFQLGQSISDIKINKIKISDVKNLMINDIEICCVDFHCYPKITNMIHLVYPHYSVEDIKKCLWECNSKINYRSSSNIDNIWIEMWKYIKDDVLKIQIKLITGYH